MAPKGPGGRPKNAWNPSRRRNLIRLYTLTQLSKCEIKEVLKDKDFNPSSSDIQKKLRSLLPPEYAKDYKSFRPSDRISMRRRLDNTRRCRGGRILKQKNRNSGLARSTLLKDAKTRRIDHFEGPLNAFSDYGTENDKSQANDAGHTWLLTGSELVFPRRILLDGSSVQANDKEWFYDTSAISGREVFRPSVPVINELQASPALSIRSLKRRLAHKYSESVLRHIGSVLRYSSSISWRSSLSSQVSLSNSDISRHASIQSGSRDLTETEQRTWNDLVQVTMLGASLSVKPRYPPRLYSCCSTSNSLTLSDTELATCIQCGIRQGHQAVIRDHHFNLFLISSGILPAQPEGSSCYSLATLTDLDFYDNTFLHYTALYCISKPGVGSTFDIVRRIVCRDADINIRNTAGETFLHILCRRKVKYIWETSAEFIETLELLKLKNFDFSAQDYHGSTVLHNLFRNSHHLKFNLLLVCRFFEIMRPDLEALDCFGSSVLDYLERCYEPSGTGHNVDSLETVRAKSMEYLETSICDCPAFLMDDNYGLAIKWRIRLNRHTRRGNCRWSCTAHDRCERCPECSSHLSLNSYLKRLDSDGDGPLASMIKRWNRTTEKAFDCSELVNLIKQMVVCGAEVQQKDRQGDTVLSVAARRGMRQVVLFLIEKKANVNSRNNNRKSILAQAQKHLFEAKDSDDEVLHAAIWSCCMVLIDAGAKIEPTAQEEWMSERGRLEFVKMVNYPRKEPERSSRR